MTSSLELRSQDENHTCRREGVHVTQQWRKLGLLVPDNGTGGWCSGARLLCTISPHTHAHTHTHPSHTHHLTSHTHTHTHTHTHLTYTPSHLTLTHTISPHTHTHTHTPSHLRDEDPLEQVFMNLIGQPTAE